VLGTGEISKEPLMDAMILEVMLWESSDFMLCGSSKTQEHALLATITSMLRLSLALMRGSKGEYERETAL
jgi:hypothetical protein